MSPKPQTGPWLGFGASLGKNGVLLFLEALEEKKGVLRMIEALP